MNSSTDSGNSGISSEARIKVLGSGCAKCKKLENEAALALKELGLPQNVEHITDFETISSLGVMITPALVIDGAVVSSGKVLSRKEIIGLLEKDRI